MKIIKKLSIFVALITVVFVAAIYKYNPQNDDYGFSHEDSLTPPESSAENPSWWRAWQHSDSSSIPPGTIIADNITYSGTFPSDIAPSSLNNLTVSGLTRTTRLYAPDVRTASPALLIWFHPSLNYDYTNAETIWSTINIQAYADSLNGDLVVAGPRSRMYMPADWDHTDADGIWWDTTTQDITDNYDIAFVRAVMVEAQRVYNVDPHRIYLAGFSNGGWFTYMVAMRINTRIAAFATASAGICHCPSTPSGYFHSGCTLTSAGASTCAALQGLGGWTTCATNCPSSNAALPTQFPTTGYRPFGYFSHGSSDTTISPFFTCQADSDLTAAGIAHQINITAGLEHYAPTNFVNTFFPIISAYTLP